MSRRQVATELFSHDPAWNEIHRLQSSREGGSVAYASCLDPGGEYLDEKIVWNGRIVAEAGSAVSGPDFSLSPDGRRLAVAFRDYGRRGRYTVRLEGGPVWETDLTTFHYNGWLDNERFAWQGWTDDERGRIDGDIRYFVNGQEMSGRLMIQGVIEHGPTRLGLQVVDDGYVYTVWDSGDTTERVKIVEGDSWPYGQTLGYVNDPEHANLRPKVKEFGLFCSVIHRGATSRNRFHELAEGGGLHAFAVSPDGNLIGYIGAKFPGWATRLASLGERLIRRLDGQKDLDQDSWSWKLATLFSPEVGPAYALVESSKRFYPVSARYLPEGGSDGRLEERVWKKGYRSAGDHFLTPSGELVVTVGDGEGQRLVVDEAEGPLFNRIWNARYLAESDRLAYIGYGRGKIFKVIVE